MSQAMRTHPDIDLLQEVNRLVAMQLACFWLRPKMVNASTISYIFRVRLNESAITTWSYDEEDDYAEASDDDSDEVYK